MAAYTYEAINAQGFELSGEIHAPDMNAAREQLRARGLLPRAVSEKSTTGESGLTGRFKKVKPKSLQVFSRQLATMIEAGVSIVAALVTLEQQTDDKYLAEVLAEVRADVEAGGGPSPGLGRPPKGFHPPLVAVGEARRAPGAPRKGRPPAAPPTE